MANNQQPLNTQQQALIDSLSPERFKPYLDEAKKHFSDPIEAQRKAIELYQWATELAGLFQIQISYLEIALRNAISRELRTWNHTQIGTERWDRNREPTLDQLIDSRKIKQAANATKNDKGHSYSPTQHDIIAKLSFGFWVNFFKYEETDPTKFHWMNPTDALAKVADNSNRNHLRYMLWTSSLEKAFPHRKKTASPSTDRDQITQQIVSIHQLRNRISHHDNILNVIYKNRLNEINSLLHSIGDSSLVNSTYRPELRAKFKADPRLKWQKTVQEETLTPSYKETLWKKIARKLKQLIKLTK